MNKIFFVAVTITSFISASESPRQSPRQSPRNTKTIVSSQLLKKSESKKLDVEEMLPKTRSVSPVVRVRKQSLGSDDFIEAVVQEKNMKTALTNRGRSDTK